MKILSGAYLALANVLLICTGFVLLPLLLVAKPRYWAIQHSIAHYLLVLGNVLRITKYHPALNYLVDVDRAQFKEPSFPHTGRVTFEAAADFLEVSTHALDHALLLGTAPELDEYGCFEARDIRLYAAELGLELDHG